MMKKFVSKVVSRLINAVPLSVVTPLLIPFIRRMAYTGVGTDACLAQQCLPVPVHFYHPIPDIDDLKKREVWTRKSDICGIDFAADRQLQFLKKIGEQYGAECDWPASATKDITQFFTENNSFSFGCAAALTCIVRHYKPKRVVEIGSGNSSLIFEKALLNNSSDYEYVIVDPYPRDLVESSVKYTKMHKQRVELLAPDFFEQLQENDILFVDSSHTVRIGSDVNFIILDILPRLAPGVIVHFHDIPLPYEYAEVYSMNPAFRVFWTESYLLQAFLSCNSSYEILLAMNWLMSEHINEFSSAFPYFKPEKHLSSSGSFWIRRTKD